MPFILQVYPTKFTKLMLHAKTILDVGDGQMNRIETVSTLKDLIAWEERQV